MTAQRLSPERLALSGKGHGGEAAFHDVLDQVLDELAAVLVDGPAHDAALDPISGPTEPA